MRERFVRVSLLCVIFTGILIQSVIPAEVPEGLVALWLLDEGSGETIKDSSENENDGVINVGTEWVDGKFGKALHFDVGDTISVPSSESLDVTDAMTIAVWFKLDNKGVAAEALRKDGAYLFAITKTADGGPVDGAAQMLLWSGGQWRPSWAPGNTELEAGKWIHAAGTYDGAQVKLYIDGKLDASVDFAGKIDVSAQNFCIGTCSGDQYEGAMDEIIIFNRALAEDEIRRLMRGYGMFNPVSYSGKLSTMWASVKEQHKLR